MSKQCAAPLMQTKKHLREFYRLPRLRTSCAGMIEGQTIVPEYPGL